MSDSPVLPKTCPQCGTDLPAGAREGLCQRCLMNEAMRPADSGAVTLGPTLPFAGSAAPLSRPAAPEPPLPEELAALLPKDAYQVEGFLGKGGMGTVYKGRQLRLRRPVAIKVMRRDQGKDHDFEQRFEREALAMAKLNHPNIVTVIDFGEAGPDFLYIVMELVEGADLMDVIRTKRMTQEMALMLLPQICDALQFAHDHGIVHRDIKPSNIMLTRDGRVKMADFGLAKHFDAENNFRTQTGTGMGTPDYAAPEQFIEHAPIDHRADIYALGVMIYQMITGALPRGAWKPPSQRAEVDVQWDDIVSHAMQNDPEDRYQQASQIKTELSRITPKSLVGSAKERSADTPVRNQSGTANKNTADKLRSREANVRAPFNAPVSPAPPRKFRSRALFAYLAGITALLLGAFFAMKKPEAPIARIASPISASSETWENLLADPSLMGAVVRAGSTMNGQTLELLGQRQVMKPGQYHNGAVRLREVFDGRRPCTLSVREHDWPNRYCAAVKDARTVSLFVIRESETTDLKSIRLPQPLVDGHEYQLELRIVGSLLSVRLDGALLATQEDSTFSGPGQFGVWNVSHETRAIRGLEFLDLDPPAMPVTASSAAPTAAAGGAPALQAATKDAPFVNSLGMKFVPVPITGGPTNGQRVLFSVWHTRVQDYAVFAKETKREWPKPGFEQGPDHPALHVNWEDGQAFCAWLTQREHAAGKLAAGERYRLPSDHEWSCAAGIGGLEDAHVSPADKDAKITDVFPWGTAWPPPDDLGNTEGHGYATSPVGTHSGNRLGLYDLSGAAWQWCEDWADSLQKTRVLRGAARTLSDRKSLSSSRRCFDSPEVRNDFNGFRCVLETRPPARASLVPGKSAP